MLGLQEMAVGIIGLCIGMLLAHAVAGSSGGGFVVFALLTLAHLACNYKAASPCRMHCTPFSNVAPIPGCAQREADLHQRRKDGRFGEQRAHVTAAAWCQWRSWRLAAFDCAPQG